MAHFRFSPGAIARLSFSVALVSLAGCDAVTPALPTADARNTADATPTAERTTVRIPTHGATRGDVFFTVGPLLPDAPFTARLESAEGRAFTVASVAESGTSASRVSLTTDGIPTDSVVVEYLREGISVAAPVVYRTGDGVPVEAGMAAEPPSSWHLIEINGKYYIEYDYGQGVVSPDHPDGVRFTTASGEDTGVTHVRFTLYGAPPFVSDAVVFSSPSTFTLDSADF